MLLSLHNRLAIGAGILFLTAACVGPGNRQTMRFELAAAPVGTEVTERQWYVFWGLVPTARSVALERCPLGVVAIRQAPGESGALAWIPTFGLLSSRTTTYFCRADV
jgi:hypothetical protein